MTIEEFIITGSVMGLVVDGRKVTGELKVKTWGTLINPEVKLNVLDQIGDTAARVYWKGDPDRPKEENGVISLPLM